jgi:NADP-dependent 3-hydroxy acid dehydrogenase YdfG
MDEIKAQYETNLFGLIRTTQAVLPIMRRQKSGTIINISSGAGRFGFPWSSAYVSTKFAVEGLRMKTEIIASIRIADAIVSYAKDKHIELIIIRSRDMSKLKSVLLGNVASDVVRDAHCAVLTVK